MPESGSGTAAQAGRGRRTENGGDPAATPDAGRGDPGATRARLKSLAGPLAGPISRVAREVRGRLTADLDDRDPDFIRENLSLSWLASSLWFRGEVRGMERIPEGQPGGRYWNSALSVGGPSAYSTPIRDTPTTPIPSATTPNTSMP